MIQLPRMRRGTRPYKEAVERTRALVTERGEVTADTVVLAGEAYLSSLPGMRRSVIPIWSLIVLTEPLPDDAWAQIGWQGHELIGSPRYTVVYLSRTADGRLLSPGATFFRSTRRPACRVRARRSYLPSRPSTAQAAGQARRTGPPAS